MDMDQDPVTLCSHQNKWKLWMFIPEVDRKLWNSIDNIELDTSITINHGINHHSSPELFTHFFVTLLKQNLQLIT